MSLEESKESESSEIEDDQPKMDEPNKLAEQTPKGAVKSLLRKFETKMQEKIKGNLINLNSQISNIHSSLFSQLDKKYGGMYKVLINTFLTNIESKIYNAEVSIEAIKIIVKEQLVQIRSDIADSTAKDFIGKAAFDEQFNNRLDVLRLEVHKEIEEAKKPNTPKPEEGSNEPKKDGDRPEDKTKDNKETEADKDKDKDKDKVSDSSN